MQQIPFPTNDKPIQQLIFSWVDLLAQEQYENALELLYQGEINPYGLNREHVGLKWNAELLRQSVCNYGLFDDELSGEDPSFFRVLEFTKENWTSFENALSIDWIDVDKERIWGLDPTFYAGIVHLGLRMRQLQDQGIYEDVTARLLIRKLGKDHIALELMDIHVM